MKVNKKEKPNFRDGECVREKCTRILYFARG